MTNLSVKQDKLRIVHVLKDLKQAKIVEQVEI